MHRPANFAAEKCAESATESPMRRADQLQSIQTQAAARIPQAIARYAPPPQLLIGAADDAAR